MKQFKSVVLATFAIVAIGIVPFLASLPTGAQSSAALSIPPKKNYTLDPGRSVNDTLVVRNLDGERELNLSVRVVDFSFMDDGGAPELFLAEDAPQTTWSLKPFLTVPETVTIPPRESRTLDVNVSIPEGQGGGSFYSAIVYSTSSPDGGNVGLSASGVTLMFTNISGDVDETMTLEKFGAYRTASRDREASYLRFTTVEPEMIAYTLKNEGNVTQSPVGSITLKNIFGGERVITNVNPNDSLALRGQTRTFTSCIKLKNEETAFEGGTVQTNACVPSGLWPGRYKATINLLYGQNGNETQEINGTAVFWYMPWWFIAVLLVVILAIAYGVWRIVRKVRGGSGKVALKNKRRRK